MADHDELLRRFQPHLMYDSNEQYFADSAVQWAVNPHNELRRTPSEDGPGELLASARPGAAHTLLSLDLLGPTQYGNGEPVRDGDHVRDSDRNYRRQYVDLRVAHPDLRNVMYGRAIESNGRLWLQYWFWYFYNDYNLAFGAGRHEGDWEMVQLRMHDDQPDVAVYAQHRHAEKRPWDEVCHLDDSPDTPLVFVARGSHASYFEDGFHETEAWYDLADGKRKAPRLRLEIIPTEGPDWMRWPGRWGDTRPRLPGGVHQPSPTGPGKKAQWRNPDSLLLEARTVARRTPPPEPDVTLARIEGTLQVSFDFARREPPPTGLVVTVNSRDEAGVPPRTYTFDVTQTARGQLRTRIPIEPAKHYDIYTSTTSGDPPVPSASRYREIEPVGAHADDELPLRLAKRAAGVFAWIRGHLGR